MMEREARRRGEPTGGGCLAARAVRAALIGCLLAAGHAPAAAGVVEERVERPTIPTDTRLYVPFFSFFTADSDEAVLTLAHPADDCAVPAEPCMSGSQCASGVCRNGLCRYPESVQVGYVAVLRKSRFCDIAACAPGPPPAACPTGVCDGGSCTNPSSNVNGLCLCDTCSETDPVAPVGDLPFADTFVDVADPRWVLSQASPVSASGRSYLKFLGPDYTDTSLPPVSPWVGQAQIRIFGLLPGEEYALFLKWTYAPYPSSEPCPLDAAITVHLATVPSVCAP